MYIKIYFNEKPVYLCDKIDENLNEILHHPDAILMDEISTPAIKSMLHEIKLPNFHAGVILFEDLETLKKQFFKHFEPIDAAGGLVRNEQDEILFIFRLGKWDLPKGKVEKGESIQAAAIREVTEETGVDHLKIERAFNPTYHTYEAFGKHFLKTTHWFEMSSHGKQKLIAQTEENITETGWYSKDLIQDKLSNTYPSIKDVFLQFENRDNE